VRYIEILTIASISLLLVLATYLIAKANPKDGSFRWIGVFLLLLALNFGDGQLYLGGFYLEYPQLAGWEEAFVLLYGPSMLFFALSATDPPFRWSTRKWIHLVPFLVAEVVTVGLYQSLSTEDQRTLIANASMMDPPLFVSAIQLAALAHVLAYTLYARRILLRHEEKLKQHYSTRVVSWAKSIFNYLIGLLAISLAATLTLQVGYPELYLVAILVIVGATGIFTFYALIQALDKPPLLAATKKTSEYSLPAEDVEQLSVKIRDYFANRRGFTNPDLTIGDVAKQLAEPVRDVSHVVNHNLARNFYDLVNSYRVQAAEQIFTTEPASAATITDVMYQVGFNSKSSFNTQFKQKTGLTPSEYRRKVHLAADSSN
jgi:AraC-like DNA-binding protein